MELVFKLHQAMDKASDVDIDEVECILANLIYKVHVGGLVSQGARTAQASVRIYVHIHIHRVRSAGTSPTRSACWC